ncbi:MAG: hypothetical protein WBM63_16210 [Sedimenticolaceae bacterium]
MIRSLAQVWSPDQRRGDWLRESIESWLDVLRDLKKCGAKHCEA